MTEARILTALDEAPVETEKPGPAYRVLKLDEGYTFLCWREVGSIEQAALRYTYPTAEDFGKRWGDGEYLYFEDSRYAQVRQMRVVAETQWLEYHGEDEA